MIAACSPSENMLLFQGLHFHGRHGGIQILQNWWLTKILNIKSWGFTASDDIGGSHVAWRGGGSIAHKGNVMDAQMRWTEWFMVLLVHQKSIVNTTEHMNLLIPSKLKTLMAALPTHLQNQTHSWVWGHSFFLIPSHTNMSRLTRLSLITPKQTYFNPSLVLACNPVNLILFFLTCLFKTKLFCSQEN